MNKWIAALLAILLAGAATYASAGQLAYVGVVNQGTGEHLPVWRHDGRYYVAGNPGDRYAIEIRNRTGARLLSVVAVDGVNVVSGATASTNQAGYVLDAWESMEIKGWRKSMDEVAAFYFTALPDSYAARTGRAGNVGVIGVALFKEYVEPIASADQALSGAPKAAAPAASARGNRREIEEEDKIGTGHGERVPSRVGMTDFRRASAQANEIISIQYDTRAHLVARGIIPRARDVAPEPVPFPGNFVPDPG